jgi:hypothetical protein
MDFYKFMFDMQENFSEAMIPAQEEWFNFMGGA